jgi:hypothetical protein
VYEGPLDDVIQEMGPIPPAFLLACEASYRKLQQLISSQEGFAEYSVRSFRSIVHDHTWFLAHQLLVEHPDCEFISDAGTEVLRCFGRYVLQVHKVDEKLRICDSDTNRPAEIKGQGYIWQTGASPIDGDIWLTIGHQPNQYTHRPERIVIGVAIEGGMSQYRSIDPDTDAIAAIGPAATETVRRIQGA